jgi:hypothetical protein
MAAWVSGLEITPRVTGVMSSGMAGSFRARGAWQIFGKGSCVGSAPRK